jgi:hypothetical protein
VICRIGGRAQCQEAGRKGHFSISISIDVDGMGWEAKGENRTKYYRPSEIKRERAL